MLLHKLGRGHEIKSAKVLSSKSALSLGRGLLLHQEAWVPQVLLQGQGRRQWHFWGELYIPLPGFLSCPDR